MDADTSPARRSPRPGPLKALLFLFVILVICAGLGAFALSLRSPEGPKVPYTAPEPISVAVIEAEMQSAFTLDESHTGLVTARRTSRLGFTGGGRIAMLSADVGDRVEEGAMLARLDTRTLRAQLAAAEASVEEARASLALARSTAGRQIRLRDEGHVAQQRVDEAAAQSETAAARLAALEAQADALRVQIDLARITAPFAGTLTQRYVDEGVIASPGAPVFELVETGHLEARIGVPSSALDQLSEGALYDLRVDGETVPARLRAVTGVIEARERTVTAMFDILDPELAPAGSIVRLPISSDVAERGLWVPVTALSESGRGLWSLLVAAPADAGGWQAEPRLVEIVHTDGARAFVRGAVESGERVIIDGLQRVAPRQPVSPREVTIAGQAGSYR